MDARRITRKLVRDHLSGLNANQARAPDRTTRLLAQQLHRRLSAWQTGLDG